MGRQRVAERDRQRKKRKIKRERRCQSSDDATNIDNGHGGAATSCVSDGGTAVAADVGRSGKKRRRRMRQQAAAAGRNAQVSTSTNETSSVSGETEVTTSNGRADHMQNIGEDGCNSSIDADTPKANVATAAASKTLEKDDDAMRIERMRLKKQQRKAAREAKKIKVQAAEG